MMKDPRAVRSREALHRALLKLLESKPLDQITIRDIAALARVGYTTFFRHHATKESLLDDVAAEQIRALIGLCLPVMDANDLPAASLALFTYVSEHRALWTTLLTGGAAAVIKEEFLRQAREIAASRSQAEGWLPAEVGIFLIVGGTLELLAWWLRRPDGLPIAHVAEIHVRLVVTPTMEAHKTGRPPGAVQG